MMHLFHPFQIYHILHTYSLLPTDLSYMQKRFIVAHPILPAKTIPPSIKIAIVQLFLCANEQAGAQSTLSRPH